MTLAILQARFSSTRLPGKVLLPLLGKPMLVRQVERIRQSREIRRIIVATSNTSGDDPIFDLCVSDGIECFRGDLNDVLDRYYQAAKSQPHDTILRLTGDCPLIDPDVIDDMIRYFHSNDLDYLGNGTPPTFPDGLDVEVMKRFVLERMWLEAKSPAQREHVTLFVYQNPDRFKRGNWSNKEDLSTQRWTVDEREDFQLIELIFSTLYPKNPAFRMNDVVKLLKLHPDWLTINRKFERNAALKKSLEK